MGTPSLGKYSAEALVGVARNTRIQIVQKHAHCQQHTVILTEFCVWTWVVQKLKWGYPQPLWNTSGKYAPGRHKDYRASRCKLGTNQSMLVLTNRFFWTSGKLCPGTDLVEWLWEQASEIFWSSPCWLIFCNKSWKVCLQRKQKFIWDNAVWWF